MVQIHGIRRASADAKYRQMTGQPVKPLILKLCLPAVISNLVTTAYNLTDTFFIGQLGTAQSLSLIHICAQDERFSSVVRPPSLAVMILETMKLRRRQPRAKSRKR